MNIRKRLDNNKYLVYSSIMDKKKVSKIQEKAHGTYQRNVEIRDLAEFGWSYARIGRTYGMSRQAVRTIVLRENGDK